MAIGIPYGKKLYCCPWMQKPWLEYIVGAHSKKYVQLLKEAWCNHTHSSREERAIAECAR
ncbi:hypothetical protein BK127_32965 [Paenibacillus sp. FSL H7-0331]|nr:hypothetical protein BK127_32965 [Paenibacillus sp. FSL H7-0331]